MRKFKLLCIVFVAILSLFSQNSFAQNNDEGLDEVCGLAGGKWHTSASGWACCWSNWGCYGCTGGNCVMQCRTPRCKKANAMNKAGLGETKLEGLAPKSMQAPIVPKKKPKKPDLKKS